MSAFARTAAILLASLSFGAGCADRCENLCEVCLSCTDSTYRKSCIASFGKGNQGVCNADVAIYRSICSATTASSESASTTTTPDQNELLDACFLELEGASSSSSAAGNAGGGGAGGSGG